MGRRFGVMTILAVLVGAQSGVLAAEERVLVRSFARVVDDPDYRPGSSRLQLAPPPTARVSGEINNTCPAFDLGNLALFGDFAGSTTGLSNTFGFASTCGSTCGFYGGFASDGIVQFTVSQSGSWRFSTCGTATFDTALQLRSGGACPGTTCLEQEDDNCDNCTAPYQAFIDASLTTGTTYYLVVDGYAGGGGDFTVVYGGPCAQDVDCDDGNFCNGSEQCLGNLCAPGTAPCVDPTPFCDESSNACTGCTNDAQCLDDGMFCNGPEVCDLQTGLCGSDGNPCLAAQTCDEISNACVDPPPNLAYAQRNHDGISFFAQDPAENPCWSPTYLIGDDIDLSDHAGRNLIGYSVLVRSRTISGFPPDGPFTVVTELWSVDPVSGLPEAPIPGTRCQFDNQPFGPGTFPVQLCQPNAGLPTGIILPEDPSGRGVDFYVVLQTSTRNAGFQIASAPRGIGGPGLDDLFAPGNPGPVFVLQDRGASCTGAWQFAQFPAPVVSDMIVDVFTDPVGPCCLIDGGCELQTPNDCTNGGGEFLGFNEVLSPNTCAGAEGGDGDGDGTRDECDACPDNSSKDAPGQCGCNVPDNDVDGDGSADCVDGCPFDPGKDAPGVCGCGVPDDDTDGDTTPDCTDGCPEDPTKTAPGICGCGTSDESDADEDGVLDCVDECPGLPDEFFAGGGCEDAIPTVSEWGVVILTLLLLTAAKVHFGRRTRLA